MAKRKTRPQINNNVELAYEVPLGNHSKARYILSGKRKLLVEMNEGATRKQYTIDLLAMSPNCKRLKEKIQPVSKLDRNLVLSLTLVALAVIAALILGLPWTVLAVALVAVAAMVTIYIVKQKTAGRGQRRKYILVSRAAQVPLVEIDFVKQSKNLDRFVTVLQERIKAALAASELDEKEMLAGELRALRRLMEDGFLDKKRYEKAKRFLLAKSS